MTDDKIALRALLEKGSDTGFLREMIGFAAERLMALEAEQLWGAAPGERSPERRNQRNGDRDRDWRHAPARSNCVSPSCATAATFQASWSRAGWPRRRSPL
jgi:putative transposase